METWKEARGKYAGPHECMRGAQALLRYDGLCKSKEDSIVLAQFNDIGRFYNHHGEDLAFGWRPFLMSHWIVTPFPPKT